MPRTPYATPGARLDSSGGLMYSMSAAMKSRADSPSAMPHRSHAPTRCSPPTSPTQYLAAPGRGSAYAPFPAYSKTAKWVPVETRSFMGIRRPPNPPASGSPTTKGRKTCVASPESFRPWQYDSARRRAAPVSRASRSARATCPYQRPTASSSGALLPQPGGFEGVRRPVVCPHACHDRREVDTRPTALRRDAPLSAPRSEGPDREHSFAEFPECPKSPTRTRRRPLKSPDEVA